MKNFFVTILCFVYMAASSGATINFHYCMGKFIGWDVAVAARSTCGNCGMHKKQKKGCCSDKHATLQLKKDQLAASISSVPNNNFFYIQNNYSTQTFPSLINKEDVIALKHIPPLLQPSSLYILNSMFRI